MHIPLHISHNNKNKLCIKKYNKTTNLIHVNSVYDIKSTFDHWLRSSVRYWNMGIIYYFVFSSLFNHIMSQFFLRILKVDTNYLKMCMDSFSSYITIKIKFVCSDLKSLKHCVKIQYVYLYHYYDILLSLSHESFFCYSITCTHVWILYYFEITVLF